MYVGGVQIMHSLKWNEKYSEDYLSLCAVIPLLCAEGA